MLSIIITVYTIFIFTLRLVVAFIIKAITGLASEVKFKAIKAPKYNDIAYAKDICEIAAVSGYIIREHVVATKDGYLLVIHKLESKSNIKSQAPINSPGKVVYFHHGLLTNSELFLVGSDKSKTLPYLLVDLGYEVWLGNNRGNKYSRKHLKLSVSDDKYWSYSLDEFALYDIPDTIEYITSFYENNFPLSPKETLKIIYIGFSQGCSQLFASLSLRPDLNNKIRLFIGLSPALVPKDLNHVVLKMIVKQAANDNSFLYRIFGKRAILPSVSFWCYLLGPRLYEKVVDKSLKFLFGWNGNNISQQQKTIGYPHMFSNSSVKSIIHWFQIISSKRFQMFDETCNIGLTGLSTLSQYSKLTTSRVAPFPVAHHLNVPMVLVYGDSDILVDIDKTVELILSQNSKMESKLHIIKCPTYEHMDTLWGENVYNDVFEKVISHIHKSFDDYS